MFLKMRICSILSRDKIYATKNVFFENSNFLSFWWKKWQKPHFPSMDFDKIWHAHSWVCCSTTVKISWSCVDGKRDFLWTEVFNWKFPIIDYHLTVHNIFFSRGIKSWHEAVQKTLFVFHKYMIGYVLQN